jgi:hypothetical protein
VGFGACVCAAFPSCRGRMHARIHLPRHLHTLFTRTFGAASQAHGCGQDPLAKHWACTGVVEAAIGGTVLHCTVATATLYTHTHTHAHTRTHMLTLVHTCSHCTCAHCACRDVAETEV